jgi:hypothetical protein
LRALAVTLPRLTRRLIGRGGFAEGGLAADWPGIVGTEMASRCQPGKLVFRHQSERREGTLTLRVEAPFAVELQHLAPQLIERINGYFGYRAVARLTLRQVPLAPPGARAPPTAPLSAEDEAALDRRLDEVEDPDLRVALGRLGRALGRRDRREDSPDDCPIDRRP